jgi:hypothetical protein
MTPEVENTVGPWAGSYGPHPRYEQAKKHYVSKADLDDFVEVLQDVEKQCPYGRIPRFDKKHSKMRFLESRDQWIERPWSASYVKSLKGFEDRVWPERVFLDYIKALRLAYFEIYGLIEHALKYRVTTKSSIELVKRFSYGINHHSYEGKSKGVHSILSEALKVKVFQFFRTFL